MNLSSLIANCLVKTGPYSSDKASKLCKGYTIGKEKWYNMFGLGATDGNATEASAEYAKNHGWNTPKKAIKGGAEIIKSRYVDLGQNTFYFQRYNINQYLINKELYPQYASAVNMAYLKGEKIYKYMSSNIKNQKLRFYIPIFKGEYK